jgi:hypothetical protein
VASYSLDLEAPDEDVPYVPTHDFDGTPRSGDTFEYDGRTWRVLEVAVKQFDAPGEPPNTIRAVLA